ncbi:TetR/AcrR family transcriptional regulator [Kribbella sp. NPDC056861]|uniref:TetR/AcrR family transcriptional regulator n=1 Tax=Kribbella sp. NPDC056861 TaxID=3154857 RepID=UPI00342A307D
MPREQGLRERKKAEQRERIADIAARLFAEHGYDGVSVLDVARTANVSDQTIYNYFPAKHDLVLDRADEFRDLYGQAVLARTDGASPADALRPLVAVDIERYRGDDPALARGQFPVLCRESGALRRFALELREQQVDRVVAALGTTDAGIAAIVARVHAAALICVVQTITDEIGAHIVAGTPTGTAAAEMKHTATIALDHLDRAFRSVLQATGDSS